MRFRTSLSLASMILFALGCSASTPSPAHPSSETRSEALETVGRCNRVYAPVKEGEHCFNERGQAGTTTPSGRCMTDAEAKQIIDDGLSNFFKAKAR